MSVRTCFLTILIVITMGALYIPDCLGAWSYRLEYWTSPYHDRRIYGSALNYTWHIQDELTCTLILPGQLTLSQGHEEGKLFPPRFAFHWRQHLGQEITGRFRFSCDPLHGTVHLEGGIEVLADPLLTAYSIVRQEQNYSLNIDVIFAPNERWALGAHLKYSKNSLLSYQLHHITDGDIGGKLSYSFSPDGSVQCLGLEIAF